MEKNHTIANAWERYVGVQPVTSDNMVAVIQRVIDELMNAVGRPSSIRWSGDLAQGLTIMWDHSVHDLARSRFACDGEKTGKVTSFAMVNTASTGRMDAGIKIPVEGGPATAFMEFSAEMPRGFHRVEWTTESDNRPMEGVTIFLRDAIATFLLEFEGMSKESVS